MPLPNRSPPAWTFFGHALAKILQIDLEYRNPIGEEKLTRGESAYSVSTADTFVEEEPTVWEWLNSVFPGPRDLWHYLLSLFPFVNWITRYNLIWLTGDLIAGITVGAVVVPQGMAYAKLAELPVQYGLYSSFMGALIYWFFATSKDITIGPVAVLSTVTGTVVLKVQAEDKSIPGHVIASALSIIAGSIVCFIGLARLGWFVEFISLAAISAFMTGSALNIAVGQVPNLMGITGFDTRAPTYQVVINILKHLGRTKLDAAMGLTALTMLYLIRWACNFAARTRPQKARIFFFLSTLRTAFVILLYTMISWLVNRHHRATKQHKFQILGTVPRGFKAAAVPTINGTIIQKFLTDLPATVIVMLIEHIAIAKSFGRVNGYTINPSQELVAIGVTNLLGPFLGAYPATGSFSRTAIKSKAGVRTPFAGVITAIVVLLAIYALPAVFFYIPQASLSAVIIHAVGDLITPPNTVYQFWRISPLEVLIFFAGVFVTVFSSIENGIYVTISVSAGLLLFRVFKAKGRFLGRVRIQTVAGEQPLDDYGNPAHHPSAGGHSSGGKYGSFDNDYSHSPEAKDTSLVHLHQSERASRTIYLPLGHHDGSNPEVEVERPYPGIFIYRFSEGFNYPNASHYLDNMTAVIFAETRRTDPQALGKPGDRPWNNPGPRRGQPLLSESDTHLPTLKAIILDFSSVNNVDITSVQHLIDVRNQLDKYTTPDSVDWHFAHINNRWTKRALASAGFGYPTPPLANKTGGYERWKPIFSVAEIGGQDSAAAAAERLERLQQQRRAAGDVEDGIHALDHGDSGSSSPPALQAHLAKNGAAVNISPALDRTLSSSSAYAHHTSTDHAGRRSTHATLLNTADTGPTSAIGADGGAGGGADGKRRAVRVAAVHGVNRPLFHIDLTSALQSAIANIQGRTLPLNGDGTGVSNGAVGDADGIGEGSEGGSEGKGATHVDGLGDEGEKIA